MNKDYIVVLKDFLQCVNNSRYFIVGSVALLSYTKPYSYDRQIQDIDIIMDKNKALEVSKKLINLGYKQNTFINPRMPFFKIFLKHSQDKFLRFSKNNLNIEILVTTFSEYKNLFIFELYPGIKAGIPKNELNISSYNGVKFDTVSVEILYLIKKIANNTVAEKVKYRQEQRYNDLKPLKKLVNFERFNLLISQVRIFIINIPFKIPKFLVK